MFKREAPGPCAAVLVALGIGLGPMRAAAVGHGETQASILAGLGRLAGAEEGLGIAGGLEVERGLSDSWAARLQAGAGLHDGVRAALVAAGATWAFDVVRVVPFVELGVSVMDARGEGVRARQDLGLHGGLGAQYLLARRWALAAVARSHWLPWRLAGPSDAGRPRLLQVGLRLGYVF